MENFFRIAAAAAMLLCAGCAGGRAVLGPDATSAVVEKGEAFEIRLKSNKTTGYGWTLVSDGSPTTSFVRQIYVPDSADGSAAVGAGGEERIEFVAVQRGKAQLELTYKRPWEKKGVDTRRFIITVK